MRNASKSRVVRLAKYLEDKKSSSRVQDVTITGCYSPDVEGAALEMMAVQAENRQAKSDKTYHLIISFREGERPDRDTITAIEKRFCENLGYGEHQRISVLHGDTENLHLHVFLFLPLLYPLSNRLSIHLFTEKSLLFSESTLSISTFLS